MDIEQVKSTESIVSMKRLFQLFFKPKHFFSDFKNLNHEPLNHYLLKVNGEHESPNQFLVQ